MKHVDFMARRFARMQAPGQPTDTDAVTGNMSDNRRRGSGSDMTTTESRLNGRE
ncbi:hypothetical protein ACSILQ_000856 [Yersinia enterocolitica]